MTRPLQALVIASIVVLISPLTAAAQERLCDTQFEDCRQPILDLINSEPPTSQGGGIDVAFWFMSDQRYSSALINAFSRGVKIRVLIDVRSNTSHPSNAPVVAALANAGIPMRTKCDSAGSPTCNLGSTYSIEILHFKTMIFHSKNMVSFSKANFTPDEYVPVDANNYSDEAVYFTDDTRLANSFQRRFDDLWVDTSVYRNYANVSGTLTRYCSSCVIDPSMNFVPLQNFQNRAQGRISAEPSGGEIDVIVFRTTDHQLPDAMIYAATHGRTVRIITDYGEYRNPERLWDAAHVDRMWSNGVQVKVGDHVGIVHEGLIVLRRLGEVIFGSSNWTSSSAYRQDEHNLFYSPTLDKPWLFDWFAQQFDRKWADGTRYPNFQPLPPDAPSYSSPSNGITGQSTSVTLRWEGGPWAHFYDIYLGTSSNPPLLAANQQIGSPNPGITETYTVGNLQPGTTYYWKIVGKTWAQIGRSGPVWSFTTSGTAPGGGGSTPFNGSPAAIPGTFQAENFDEGGQNVAYYDTTSTNSGGAYRSTGVDVEATTDSGGGFDVGWTKAGEWLKYTVNIASAGTYSLSARVANTASGGTFRIEVDGTDKGLSIAVPNTGGWQSFTTITTPGMSLPSGQHVIRIVFTATASSGGVGNFNWFRFDSSSGGTSSTPFGGTPAPVPGTIQAENFDNGGQNVAYNDTTSTNSGGAYRTTGVDIEATTDSGGGFDVGWTKAGEWMKYTVNVTTSGTYTLQTRVANPGSGGSFRVEVDGTNQTGTLNVPNTGGWQSFQTITSAGFSLSAGQHVIRVVFLTVSSSGGAGNFNWFRLDTTTTTASTAYGGTPAALPGTVQAENFDNGGQSVAYNDTTPTNSGGAYRTTGVDIEATADSGGGYDVGWAKTGEWMKYTVSVAAAGTYRLLARVANTTTGGSFHVEVDGTNKTGTMNVPDTNDWQQFQTITSPTFSLSAGQHVMRVVFLSAGASGGAGNFNWFQISS